MIILRNTGFFLELERPGNKYLLVDSRWGWLVVQNHDKRHFIGKKNQQSLVTN